jgi:hypothetical protein
MSNLNFLELIQNRNRELLVQNPVEARDLEVRVNRIRERFVPVGLSIAASPEGPILAHVWHSPNTRRHRTLA